MPSLSQSVFSENESHRTVSQLISETNSILQSVSCFCKEIPLHKSQVFAKGILSYSQPNVLKMKFHRTISQLLSKRNSVAQSVSYFLKQIPSHIQSVVF